MVFGPDGNLYISTNSTNKVVRYTPDGTYIDNFATAHLVDPFGMAFDASGYLLVVDAARDKVDRYQGPDMSSPGTWVDTLIDATMILQGPAGMRIGPDGNLYIVSRDTSSVLRFEPDGDFIDEFVPPGYGGLSFPHSLVFVVPEPATVALVGVGLLGVFAAARKRGRKSRKPLLDHPS